MHRPNNLRVNRKSVSIPYSGDCALMHAKLPVLERTSLNDSIPCSGDYALMQKQIREKALDDECLNTLFGRLCINARSFYVLLLVLVLYNYFTSTKITQNPTFLSCIE